MRLTVRGDIDDLALTLLNLRAIQAFDHGPAHYPIHRVVRCAARGLLVSLFDDLALRAGLTAQRLDAGLLLLDGPGVLAALQGRPKADYSSCTFTLWTDTPAHADRITGLLLAIVGERRIQDETFTIDWRFSAGHGGLSGASFEELADPALLDEAYPTLGEPVAQFIERYLSARETVLILQGPPALVRRASCAPFWRQYRDVRVRAQRSSTQPTDMHSKATESSCNSSPESTTHLLLRMRTISSHHARAAMWTYIDF